MADTDTAAAFETVRYHLAQQAQRLSGEQFALGPANAHRALEQIEAALRVARNERDEAVASLRDALKEVISAIRDFSEGRLDSLSALGLADRIARYRLESLRAPVEPRAARGEPLPGPEPRTSKPGSGLPLSAEARLEEALIYIERHPEALDIDDPIREIRACLAALRLVADRQKQEAAPLRGALERIAEQQQMTLKMIERNGFVFDSIGSEPGNWQHLAFTIYTDLCEVDSIARAALAGDDGPRVPEGAHTAAALLVDGPAEPAPSGAERNQHG